MKKNERIRLDINNFLQIIKKNNISEFAAQGAYYIILSFIPFIILLLTLIQYIGIDKQNLYLAIKTIIPNTMNETILGIVQEVYSKSIGTISVSIVFALWASGKGFYSLGDAKKEFTYIDNSESVTIYYIGDFMPRTYKYFIEENVLSIEDSFGNLVRYKRNKEWFQ